MYIVVTDIQYDWSYPHFITEDLDLALTALMIEYTGCHQEDNSIPRYADGVWTIPDYFRTDTINRRFPYKTSFVATVELATGEYDRNRPFYSEKQYYFQRGKLHYGEEEYMWDHPMYQSWLTALSN